MLKPAMKSTKAEVTELTEVFYKQNTSVIIVIIQVTRK